MYKISSILQKWVHPNSQVEKNLYTTTKGWNWQARKPFERTAFPDNFQDLIEVWIPLRNKGCESSRKNAAAPKPAK
jgi:hypothetical protein